ncbi:MAG TPA: 30S ribosomal protein S17 [Candidatus Nanoarchaeia archaeon]|nr:30S ribosomal protein S17 [Candidatus Nanoarchaeia archaeon]
MARTMRGTVVSDKMDKTVVVAVSSVKTHPIYRKKYSVTAKFKAHDEGNSYKTGDLVEISESRPLSATKRWVATRKVTAKELEG